LRSAMYTFTFNFSGLEALWPKSDQNNISNVLLTGTYRKLLFSSQNGKNHSAFIFAFHWSYLFWYVNIIYGSEMVIIIVWMWRWKFPDGKSLVAFLGTKVPALDWLPLNLKEISPCYISFTKIWTLRYRKLNTILKGFINLDCRFTHS
jgi:hypothetical protein